MPVVKFLPVSYNKYNYFEITNPNNALTDVSSSNYAVVNRSSLASGSNIGNYNFKFDFSEIPDNSTIQKITVKAKAVYYGGYTSSNSGYRVGLKYTAGTAAMDKLVGQISTVSANTYSATYTDISLETLKSDNFEVVYALGTVPKNSIVAYVYGNEITVEYEEPPKIYNKVEFGEEVLIDLTSDTVTPSSLLEGYTAHDNTGALITGTASSGGNLDGKVYQDGDGYVVLDDDEGTHKEIDALTVTTNGTYTAPTGHAYDPVTVNVPTGGGGSSSDKKQINFIDYDGTILHSYTPTEWASVTALPSNPSHTGLIAQGWNWTKAKIDSQLTAQPEADIWVGQMYETASGKTEIDINVDNPEYLSPYLAIAVNGTATIDWGDGTSTDTITGASYTALKYTPHTYTTTGRYTINIDGPIGFYCNSSSNGALLTTATSLSTRRTYSRYIEAIRCADNIRIGSCAFSNCYALQSITIPDRVTSIGSNVFHNCYALQSITIPDGITSIGTNTFYYCFALQSITIPDGVTYIGTQAFNKCYALQSITIPDGITSIGSNVFQNCYALQSITIPDGVTSIETNVFQNCYALQSITIPDRVTSIGSSAFQQCYSVMDYHILPVTPPTLSTSVFSGMVSGTKIHVPAGSLEAYQTATNWSTYASYMEEE